MLIMFFSLTDELNGAALVSVTLETVKTTLTLIFF